MDQNDIQIDEAVRQAIAHEVRKEVDFPRANAVWPDNLRQSQLILARATYEALEEHFQFETDDDRRLVLSYVFALGNVVISSRASMARILERRESSFVGDDASGKILQRLVDRYLPGAHVTGYIRGFKARKIDGVQAAIPKRLRNLIANDLSSTPSDIRAPVLVATGRPWNWRIKKAEGESRVAQLTPSAIPGVAKIQAFLNAQPPRAFQFPKDAVSACYLRAAEFSEPARSRHRRTLRDLIALPKPIYTAYTTTPRLHALGYSLQNCPSWMRRTLGRNWIELDLQSAALAIAQYHWDLPELGTRLNDGVSIWKTLHKEIAPRFDQALFKVIVKTYAISMLMAAGSNGAAWYSRLEHEAVTGRFPSNKLIKDVQAHPVFEEIRQAAWDEARAVIREPTTTVLGAELDGSTLKPSNIISQLLFSYEWPLLAPVVQLAMAEADRKNPRFRLMIWQHDGFSINVLGSGSSRRKTVVNELQALVQERAREMGIMTRLVVDHGTV